MVDHDRRKVLRLLASTPLLSPAAASWLAACDKDDDTGGAAAPGADPSREKAAPEAKREEALPWQAKQITQNLAACLSFASLHRDGLFIDYGTSDCFKYTLGGWRSGWGLHRNRDGVPYTHATSTSSRIYFYWDKREAVTARFRIQRVASTWFSLYANGKPVEKVDIDRVDWTTYETTIPAELVQEGANQLLLRWEKTVPAMGEDVAAAVDYVQLVAAKQDEEKTAQGAKAKTHGGEGALPRQARLIREVDHQARKVHALSLGQDTTLAYWVQIPDLKGAVLGLHAAVRTEPGEAEPPPMKLSVRARRDGSPAAELVGKEVSSATFSPVEVDLEDLRGEVVRLEIGAQASRPTDARLTLLEPTLYATHETKATKPETPAKNVIVVMIDTLRADHTPPYADTRVKAPAFAAFAEQAAVFDRYSAVEDWTKPSCATMLTGLYPITHKTQADAAKLPDSVRMITEDLQQQGIKTGGFIANGYVSDKFGFGRGWDHYTNYIRETRNTEAENVFGEAFDWIEERKKAGERFYAYVQTIDPHVPYDPPDEFYKMYDEKGKQPGDLNARNTGNLLEDIKKGKYTVTERDKVRLQALYDGEISYHDKWFGDFLEKLDKAGLGEDTLVMVLSDHGEEFWEHGGVGHGHQLHQELIHVPFLMRWKGTIEAGQHIAENYDHSTLAPTVFDAMGLKPPSYFEGSSVLPRAMGALSPAPHAGFSTHQGDREAVWSSRWKIVHRGPARVSLFDVDKDPQCQNDLEEKNPVALCYMRALLGQFQGAGNKRRWRSHALEDAVAQVEEEKIEIDPETSKQLENLGYFR